MPISTVQPTRLTMPCVCVPLSLSLPTADYRQTVLLLMSLYLDNASLPSPCWMMTGAMARVCQDAVLDKEPPPHMFSETELECRRRLFWAAFIQERKECLKKGRATVMQDDDIEVPLPRLLELELRIELCGGLGGGLGGGGDRGGRGRDQGKEQLAEGEEEDEDEDEGEGEGEGEDEEVKMEEQEPRDRGGAEGGLSAGRVGLGDGGRVGLGGRRRSRATKPLSAEESLRVMTAQIHISTLCSALMAVHATESGSIHDLERIQDLDHRLKRAWDGFPAHLTDLQTTAPLDMGAIRRAFPLLLILAAAVAAAADTDPYPDSALLPAVLPPAAVPLLHRAGAGPRLPHLLFVPEPAGQQDLGPPDLPRRAQRALRPLLRHAHRGASASADAALGRHPAVGPLLGCPPRAVAAARVAWRGRRMHPRATLHRSPSRARPQAAQRV